MRASDKRERSTIRLTEDATPRTAQPPHRAKLQLRELSYAGASGALAPQGQYGYEVQRRALSPLEGAGDAAGVHNAAAHGTRGGGNTLPFLPQIQASFGHHDLSSVRAHTDGGAAAACAAIGASAYASGHDVAFGASPDLHTTAHEAAHVVQQRAGVSLKGGVGAVGDPYEQHADAVADLVVQGKSAEGLLDSMAPGTGPASGAVQLNAAPPDKGGGDIDTPVEAPTPAPTDTQEETSDTVEGSVKPEFSEEELAQLKQDFMGKDSKSILEIMQDEGALVAREQRNTMGYLYETPTQSEMEDSGIYNCTTFASWALRQKGIDVTRQITIGGRTASINAFVNIQTQADAQNMALKGDYVVLDAEDYSLADDEVTGGKFRALHHNTEADSDMPTDERMRGIAAVMVELGLGTYITDEKKLRPGDLLQSWKTNSSGHCEAVGTITGHNVASEERETLTSSDEPASRPDGGALEFSRVYGMATIGAHFPEGASTQAYRKGESDPREANRKGKGLRLKKGKSIYLKKRSGTHHRNGQTRKSYLQSKDSWAGVRPSDSGWKP